MCHKKQVHGTRFTEKYLQARQAYGRSSYSSYSSYSSGIPSRPATKSTPVTPVLPKVPASPTSPRKVISDFGTFSAPANASVFGTAVASSPFSLAGGKAAFGGMRTVLGRTSFDDDEEEEEGEVLGGTGTGKGGLRPQRVELREDSISLDQVCTAGRFPLFCAHTKWSGETNCNAKCMAERSGITLYILSLLYPPRSRLFF